VINLAREYPTQNVQDMLVHFRPTDRDTLDSLRAKFFLLLNQDMQMRRTLGEPRGKAALVAAVCDHKATRFYDELSAEIIPRFAQNQRMTLVEFVDMLKECYLCS
jgi:hypothetical protein